MSKRDYYEVLGVSRDADEKTIKSAFRKRAAKFHPDRNPGDKTAEEKFKEAREAYEVLSDGQKRQRYDQGGHAAFDPSMGGFGGGAGMGDIFGDFDLGKVFEDMFTGGGGGRRSGDRAQHGADLAIELSVSLEDAVHGSSQEITVPTWVACEPCGSTGAKKGSSPTTCSTCGGLGQVRMNHGFLTVQQVCPDCGGSGQVIKDPCPHCRGQGRVRKKKKLSVKLPAGIGHGDRIRLSGEGEAGVAGGAAGDLYVEVRIKPHDVFKRDGNDLKMDVPITFAKAVMGGDIEVPTLAGRVKLSVPPETQSGKVFRIRGKGVKAMRGSRSGDLLCRIIIETPVRLTAEQKNMLRDFDKSLSGDAEKHRPRATRWFESVKRFFTQTTR